MESSRSRITASAPTPGAFSMNFSLIVGTNIIERQTGALLAMAMFSLAASELRRALLTEGATAFLLILRPGDREQFALRQG